MVNPINPDGKLLYRVGGISALAIGIAYLIIFPLFAHVGAPPGRVARFGSSTSKGKPRFGGPSFGSVSSRIFCTSPSH
jgi:hypothetical protein